MKHQPNLRQLVVFAILMEQNEGILAKYKRYVFEKFEVCTSSMVPEKFLDAQNMIKFRAYAGIHKMNWDSARDYNHTPINRLDTPTGEPMSDEDWERHLRKVKHD